VCAVCAAGSCRLVGGGCRLWRPLPSMQVIVYCGPPRGGEGSSRQPGLVFVRLWTDPQPYVIVPFKGVYVCGVCVHGARVHRSPALQVLLVPAAGFGQGSLGSDNADAVMVAGQLLLRLPCAFGFQEACCKLQWVLRQCAG